MHVIINKGAGAVVQAGGADALARQVTAQFAEAGVSVEVVMVDPGALEEAIEHAKTSAAGIIVGGGDGTVATAVRLLRGQSVPLGILPMGTLNLLARDLHIPVEINEAVAVLACKQVSKIDVAEVNGSPFTCVCLLGFYPQLKSRQADYHGVWWRKSMIVFRAALRSYQHFPPLNLTLQVHGAERRFRTRLVTVANNAFTHNPGILPSRACLNAGILTAYVSTHRRVGNLLQASFAFMTGMWEDDPDIYVEEGHQAVINCARRSSLNAMLDGELIKVRLPLHFKLHPKQLAVFCGSPPPASDPDQS